VIKPGGFGKVFFILCFMANITADEFFGYTNLFIRTIFHHTVPFGFFRLQEWFWKKKHRQSEQGLLENNFYFGSGNNRLCHSCNSHDIFAWSCHDGGAELILKNPSEFTDCEDPQLHKCQRYKSIWKRASNPRVESDYLNLFETPIITSQILHWINSSWVSIVIGR
jgi:hypothetical protein